PLPHAAAREPVEHLGAGGVLPRPLDLAGLDDRRVLPGPARAGQRRGLGGAGPARRGPAERRGTSAAHRATAGGRELERTVGPAPQAGAAARRLDARDADRVDDLDVTGARVDRAVQRLLALLGRRAQRVPRRIAERLGVERREAGAALGIERSNRGRAPGAAAADQPGRRARDLRGIGDQDARGADEDDAIVELVDLVGAGRSAHEAAGTAQACRELVVLAERFLRDVADRATASLG